MAIEKETILFSCLGSTDPVRGGHDGGMLHITRHYRPNKIKWFISKEMAEAEKKDNRYRLSIDSLKPYMPDYSPEILEPIYDDSEDVSDFDAFFEPFEKAFDQLREDHPKAELLVNLSSGTPQMKMTLAMLSLNTKYRITPIQVKNSEKKAGTSTRTVAKEYDLMYELELNEDNEEGSINRCCVPQLLSIRRKEQHDRIVNLLHSYDYHSLLTMERSFSQESINLIRHLAERSTYNLRDAEKAANTLRGDLYPANQKKAPSYREYYALSEYILMLKLMQRTHRLTDLVIRLNPLVVRLQIAFLSQNGAVFDRNGIPIETESFHIPKNISIKYGDKIQRSSCGIGFYNDMCSELPLKDTGTLTFFEELRKLNSRERNSAAHSLDHVTEENIRAQLGYGSSQLVTKLIALLKELFPQHYREELFSIYDTCNADILKEF